MGKAILFRVDRFHVQISMSNLVQAVFCLIPWCFCALNLMTEPKPNDLKLPKPNLIVVCKLFWGALTLRGGTR